MTTEQQVGPDTAAQRKDGQPEEEWWRQAVVYELYVRSFADGNGDGIGDLSGILGRMDYLSSLGVDAVWLTPFYPSALADGGYDIDDHRAVDPRIGTLEQFAHVVTALHERDIKVIIDIVPNHSSDRHPHFVAALEAPRGSDERERYVFRDGRGRDGELPPSDWESLFGGPAWTRVPDGQWYLHLFTLQQPDWNWTSRQVRSDFEETLRFWADRGVDGFRIDAATTLTKDMSEPLPPWEAVRPGLSRAFGGGGPSPFSEGQHPIWDRDDVQDVYNAWRHVFDQYDPPRFGAAEAWVEPHRRARYARREGLGQSLDFDLAQAAWDAAAYTQLIRRNLDLAEQDGSSSTWVLSNHDIVRHATRLAEKPAASSTTSTGRPLDSSHAKEHLAYARTADHDEDEDSDAGAAEGLHRALAATLLALALPGSTYLYQGEELGLPEVRDIPEDQLHDRTTIKGVLSTRDGCRVPLPWTTHQPFYGFSNHAAHLPQPPWFARYAVQTQDEDHASTLNLYRHALRLRRNLLATDQTVTWLDLGPEALAFRRTNGWTSITNFSTTPLTLPPGDLLLATHTHVASIPTAANRIAPALPANATAWLHT